MILKTKGEKETKNLGNLVAQQIQKKSDINILTLKGNLGSGKTTFVKGFAKEFGIDEITSPTFVIMKKYPLESKKYNFLIHIDCYRLKSKKELKQLNFKEISEEKKNIILIEWPEIVKKTLKSPNLIEFKFISEKEREIKISDKLNLKIKENKL